MRRQEIIAADIEGLARVAGAFGQTVRSARLLGSAAAVRRRLNMPRTPILVRGQYGRTASATYIADVGVPSSTAVSLDAASWESAWAEGEAMSMEEAIAYALDDAN